MIEYLLKPNMKTAFFKAGLKFDTTNQLFKHCYVLCAGFIRGLEKYGKVWNKIWSISRPEKAGKKFFFGLLVWKKKLFFQT